MCYVICVLALTDANIVDPESSKLLKGMTLLIKDKIVTTLRKTEPQDRYVDLSSGAAKKGKVVDASGVYICPGLIDSK